ncbi:MAG: hypothetical protein AB4063_12510, partial [Crocosphaera sp.]
MTSPTPQSGGGQGRNPNIPGGGAGGHINGGRGMKGSGLSGGGNLGGRGYWPNSQYTGNGGKFTGGGGGGGGKPYTPRSHFGGKSFRPKPKGTNGKNDFTLNNSRKNIGQGDPNQYRPWNRPNPKPQPRSNGSSRVNSGRGSTAQSGKQSNLSSGGTRKPLRAFSDVVIKKAQNLSNKLGIGLGSKARPQAEKVVRLPPPRQETAGAKVILEDPPFQGGQVLGAYYRYRVRYDVYSFDNPWILGKLSGERTNTGPIIGIVITGTELRPRINVAFTNVSGGTSLRSLDSASYNGVNYRNYSFEYIERVDGTSKEDDRTEGGDPPPPKSTEPPKFIGTLGPIKPPGLKPPPANFIPVGGLGVKPISPVFTPKPNWSGVGKPAPNPNPKPTTNPISVPSPNPISTQRPIGQPIPRPITRPTGGKVTFFSPSSGAGTTTGTGGGTGTGSGITIANSPPATSQSPSPTPSGSGGLTPPLTPLALPPPPEGSTPKRTANPKPTTIQKPTNTPKPFSPSPLVPPGAGGTTNCSSCMKGLHNKVDVLNTALGIGNAASNLIDLGLLNIINNKLGDQVPGGLSGWLKRFSGSLRLDRAMNVLNTMLLIHNAAQLSANLGESLSYFINSGLQAVGLQDEDENPININQMVGGFVSTTIKTIVGEELYTGLSEGWKKTSAIYRSAMNMYELTLSSMAGIAEGLEIASQYTGKIGNALKKGGVIIE